MARRGNEHSPPTNSKAIRRSNIQAVLGRSKGIVWRSDTPSVIAKAADKSPHVKAYAPTRGQGEGPLKPKVTPANKRKFAGMGDPSHYSVDKVTGKPGSCNVKIATKHKQRPQEYKGEYERQHRSDGKRYPELDSAEYQRIKGTLGLKR